MDAVENGPFLEKVRSTSKLRLGPASSAIAARAETTQSREPDREPSEATIPLEAKEAKRRGRPKKQEKPSGDSNHEKNESRRRRDECDSDGEGNGETRKCHRVGSRQGNGRGKHGSDCEPTKSSTTRACSPKGQHSCAVAMGHKLLTVKSVVRSGEPIAPTVTERGVVLALPTQAIATARNKATLLTTTVGRVKSPVQIVEKGLEKQSISKSADLRKHGQYEYSSGGRVRHDRDGETKDSGQGGHLAGPATTHVRGIAARGRPYACRLQHSEGVDTAIGAEASFSASDPTPVLESTSPQFPVMIPLVGPRTPPDTPPQPIVSESRLGLVAQPRIPSPRTA